MGVLYKIQFAIAQFLGVSPENWRHGERTLGRRPGPGERLCQSKHEQTGDREKDNAGSPEATGRAV